MESVDAFTACTHCESLNTVGGLLADDADLLGCSPPIIMQIRMNNPLQKSYPIIYDKQEIYDVIYHTPIYSDL